MQSSSDRDQAAESEIPGQPIDIEAARHPTEPSRYLVAVLAASVFLGFLALFLVGGAGALGALLAVPVIGLFLATFWLALQVHRVRMLAAGVKVTPRATPELHAAVEDVRQRLGYSGRAEVYITESVTENMLQQSVLGTRILILKGDFAARLINARRAELTFLLATYFGALKARHDRLNVVLVALSLADGLKVVSPFLKPWYRSTVYTGDQLAFLCCNDLRVSLSAAFRALVGQEMAPLVRATGVVDQASNVRRSVILRLTQVFADAPLPTNRYLNLLAFSARNQHLQYDDFLADLEQDMARYVEAYRVAQPARPGTPGLHALANALGCAVVAVAVVLGLLFGGELDLETSGSDQAALSSAPDAPPTDTAQPSEPTPSAFSYDSLVSVLPPGFATSCQDISAGAYEQYGASLPGLSAAASCTPVDPETPRTVLIYRFETSDSANDAFSTIMEQAGATSAGDWVSGDCETQAPARYQWVDVDGGVGLVGCYTTQIGEPVLVWWDDSSLAVSIAIEEPEDSFDDVRRWWEEFPVLSPDGL